jgi:hypothetical protein
MEARERGGGGWVWGRLAAMRRRSVKMGRRWRKNGLPGARVGRLGWASRAFSFVLGRWINGTDRILRNDPQEARACHPVGWKRFHASILMSSVRSPCGALDFLLINYYYCIIKHACTNYQTSSFCFACHDRGTHTTVTLASL